MAEIDPILVAAKVTRVLEELGVPYFIGGSVASTLHGMVRTTQDVDIIANLQDQHAQPFVNRLFAEFFIDEQMVADAIQRHASFNIIHRESVFKVDVFIPEEREFAEKQFSRSRIEILYSDPEIKAVVSTPEDTILAKLRWYRQGGEVSDQQWRDILGLLKVQGSTLDRDYLRATAGELHLLDLLNKALEEAGTR